MKTSKSSAILCTIILFLFGLQASAGISDKGKKESNWSKKFKEMKLKKLRSNFQSNETYPQPFLTIHLGASYVINTGNVQLNSAQVPGTKISLHNTLGMSRYYISPRLNAIINFGNFHGIAFDTYTMGRRGNEPAVENIKFGDTTFLAGNNIKSKVGLLFVNLAYNYFFHHEERTKLGIQIGASGTFYNLKISKTDSPEYDQKKSIFVPLPSIGFNGSVYLGKNVFLRGVVRYSAWWSKNYNCNIIDLNPYIEYYIYKNLGLGVRYHYSLINFKNLPDSKFDGNIKNSFSAVSLVAVYRFIKKDSKTPG